MPDFAPETLHARLMDSAPRILRFDPEAYPPEWISAARRTFKQLLGPMPAPAAPAVRITARTSHPGFDEVEFLFTAEPGADVPCWLLVPADRPGPLPLIVCLQGHSSGAHLSLGQARYPGDGTFLADDLDLALQAVRQGFAALAIEQRGFGLRSDRRRTDTEHFNACHHAAMTGLLLGRTMAGQRVFDVSRAIDAMAELPADIAGRLDSSRIGCVGHSGGGLISFYAAAVDPRIAAVMPSCALATYRASIGAVDHCGDNYLPGILHYFEMADLAGLIAPRPMVVVSGRADPLFPHPGVEAFMADAEVAYRTLGAPDKLRWIVGDGGHRFYADLAWPAFRALTGW